MKFELENGATRWAALPLGLIMIGIMAGLSLGGAVQTGCGHANQAQQVSSGVEAERADDVVVASSNRRGPSAQLSSNEIPYRPPSLPPTIDHPSFIVIGTSSFAKGSADGDADGSGVVNIDGRILSSVTGLPVAGETVTGVQVRMVTVDATKSLRGMKRMAVGGSRPIEVAVERDVTDVGGGYLLIFEEVECGDEIWIASPSSNTIVLKPCPDPVAPASSPEASEDSPPPPEEPVAEDPPSADPAPVTEPPAEAVPDVGDPPTTTVIVDPEPTPAPTPDPAPEPEPTPDPEPEPAPVTAPPVDDPPPPAEESPPPATVDDPLPIDEPPLPADESPPDASLPPPTVADPVPVETDPSTEEEQVVTADEVAAGAGDDVVAPGAVLDPGEILVVSVASDPVAVTELIQDDPPQVDLVIDGGTPISIGTTVETTTFYLKVEQVETTLTTSYSTTGLAGSFYEIATTTYAQEMLGGPKGLTVTATTTSTASKSRVTLTTFSTLRR